jgi:hypothetical protein
MNAQLETLQLSMDSPGVLSITLNRPAAFNALSMVTQCWRTAFVSHALLDS